jgi:hypothetical protein
MSNSSHRDGAPVTLFDTNTNFNFLRYLISCFQ